MRGFGSVESVEWEVGWRGGARGAKGRIDER